MGLRVEKTFVRRKKNQAEAAKTEEDTKIMFDLEKVNMEDLIGFLSPPRDTVVEEVEEIEDSAAGGHSPVDIFKLEEKTRVTFDDILNSLQAKETVDVNKVSPSSDDELNDV